MEYLVLDILVWMSGLLEEVSWDMEIFAFWVYCLLGYSFVIEISLVEFCDQVSGINPQAHKGLETETFKGFVVIDAVITNCTKFLGNMSECRDFGMLCRRCIY